MNPSRKDPRGQTDFKKVVMSAGSKHTFDGYLIIYYNVDLEKHNLQQKAVHQQPGG